MIYLFTYYFFIMRCILMLLFCRVCHLNKTNILRGLETYQGLSVRMSLYNMKRGRGDSSIRLNNGLKFPITFSGADGFSFDWYARKTLDDLLNVTLSASNPLERYLVHYIYSGPCIHQHLKFTIIHCHLAHGPAGS